MFWIIGGGSLLGALATATKWGWVEGLNSITVYLGVRIVNFMQSSEFLLGFIAGPSGVYGDVILQLGVISLEWIILYYLYKNKIFLRI